VTSSSFFVQCMGEAFGQMLPIAIAIAASPAPIAVAVLMLVSVRPRANGLAFGLGWIAGIAGLGALVLAIAGTAEASDDGDPSTWVSLLKLGLGAVLLVLALRQWRGRPSAGDDVPMPAWMGAMHAFTPLKAAGVGVGLSAVNPKNVLFVIAAAATEAQAGLSAGRQVLTWALFTCVATLGVAVPVLIYFALGERAPPLLERLNVWLLSNKTTVMAVLCLVIGATLIGNAIGGLSA
jgi:threonine/homoserine/homoserine lactone efflux protein